MDPVALSDQIVERYQRYLEASFYFKDPVLRKSFQEALRKGHLSRGPYLEATPVFRKGKKSQELFLELLTQPVDDGLLKAVVGDRLLYFHQQEAVEKVFGKLRNVVVATGTASGKTETFLYPILLHLYKEFCEGQLGPGIRALILYPMNALANDQRGRLGEICWQLMESGSPFEFTFGQYIGETPRDENDSERHARDHLANRLPGELVLRKEMWESPPHVLLTNYSMLEYLLIRPDDSPLFDDGRAQWWTFLVLDEAHQYRGSKGIEMSMLLRRLKRRLREGGKDGSFRCIATSATIAGGERDKPAVARFASDLFGEEFREEDVILGETEPIPDSSPRELPSDYYPMLSQALNAASPRSLSEAAGHLGVGVPEGLETRRAIGFLLQQDHRSTKLRQIVTGTPMDIRQLAEQIFPELPLAERMEALSELVELLVLAEDPNSGLRLLSARYHLFLRSLEGAFVSFCSSRRVYLERQSQAAEEAAFEVALCRECGQHYLVGRFKDRMLQEAIRDPGHPDFGATFFRPVADSAPDTDEQAIGAPKKKRLRLCVRCASMEEASGGQDTLSCGHSESILVEQQEGTEEKEDQLPSCSACGYRGQDPVREVIHGTDGPHAVIATVLCQKLPEQRRKVLAFADGRQEAAFFAWYFENSYRDILNRGVILECARTLGRHAAQEFSLRELAVAVRDAYREKKMFPASIGDLELRREAWVRVYREFLTDEPRISLEGVGLIRWYPNLPENFRIPEIFSSSPWSLSKEQARDLIVILLDSMRTDRAVELRTSGDVSLHWSDLEIQGAQMRVRVGPPRGRARSVRSWDGPMGKRVQFLAKLLARKGVRSQDATPRAQEALRVVWEALRESDGSIVSQDRFLLPIDDARRLNPDWWRLSVLSDGSILYRCNTCGRLQHTHVGGVCTRHKCPGTVEKIKSEELEANHYRLLYQDDLPAALRVEEHTAQIDKEKAREFQKEFKEGKIHVLSSSTTFELGVDLGDLDTIFLRNVPPEAFNYAQRVGRAGRRAGFPGFAVTFCRRNPHDLYHFAEPDNRILRGTIRPPVISLKNKKIISRHIAAVVLSYFFRWVHGRFQNVEGLFGDIEDPSAVKDLLNFLEQQRSLLEESLASIVPHPILNEIERSDGGWIQNIAGENSRLAAAEAEISSDFRAVRRLEEASVAAKDYRSAEWASRRARTIATESTLAFLSRKAIIPKYGFPVDVVELDPHRTQRTSESSGVLFERDLSIAIAEFAPTSRLVANKKEWTSYGLKKVVEKEWDRKHYRRCSKHNLFMSWSPGETAPLERCCGSVINGKYLVPRFGFVTHREEPKVPRGRAPRSFSTRPYFLNLAGPHPGELGYGLIRVTRASPGLMVVLCEGRKGRGFWICTTCGTGFRELSNQHQTCFGEACSGSLDQFALGHEFVTDVIQIQFTLGPPRLVTEALWFAYSLAYALVEGSAEILEVPSSDLSAAVAYRSDCVVPPVILYDNVPGGAGLVARIEEKEVLRSCLEAALDRVQGGCGCGDNDSCYGCLRSYRNQFAQQQLRRGPVKEYLETLLRKWA